MCRPELTAKGMTGRLNRLFFVQQNDCYTSAGLSVGVTAKANRTIWQHLRLIRPPVWRLRQRQLSQQLSGLARIQGWSSHSRTKAKGTITSERPDLGSIASTVKGMALCQLCEQ